MDYLGLLLLERARLCGSWQDVLVMAGACIAGSAIIVADRATSLPYGVFVRNFEIVSHFI